MWLAAVLIAALQGCSTSAQTERAAQSIVVAQCTRDEPTLRGPAIDCVVDADCGCGSYCDAVAHTCKFDCMIPPANQAESCAAGTQCDNTGRCTGANQTPAPSSVVMVANPPGLSTIAGGAAISSTVQLSVGSASLVNAAMTTRVRVIGNDGAEVSCNATAFVAECVLDSWAFVFDGTRFNATRPMWVRTRAGTAPGHGDVLLRIDALDRELAVPAGAGATNTDGDYQGVAVASAAVDGHAITATARGNLIVVRDPTRTIAPDGALILDLGATKQVRQAAWLRPPGAAPTAGAIAASYVAGTVSFTPATHTLIVPLSLNVSASGTAPLDTYTLRLQRVAAPTTACTTTADCATGNVCLTAVRACVPAVVVTPPPLAGNQFEDPRSAQWWAAMKDVIGSAGSATGRPEFATTHADLIESLMCTTTAGPGHLSASQVKDAGGRAHSGDLRCVANGPGAQGENRTPNGSPSAIGLGTVLDRTGSASSSALLETCLADLARPVTSAFATSFAVSTGSCVNLARALPALRLLATDELGKLTGHAGDRELATLLQRLLQQWSELQGFLASTGLARGDLEEATSVPSAQVRQRLATLLDVLDAGWAALLDKRMAGPLRIVSRRAAGDELATFTPDLDYRAVREPALYWTFNGATPGQDLIRHVPLTSSSPNPFCQLNTQLGDLRQSGAGCPPLEGRLAPADAGLLDTVNQTFVFHLSGLGDMFPPAPGAIVMTPTFHAEITIPNGTDGDGVLTVRHPFTNGLDIERVDFPELGRWAGYRNDGASETVVAIVRDGNELTYTLNMWTRCDGADALTGCVDGVDSVFHTVTRSYAEDISGKFFSPAAVRAGSDMCLFDDDRTCGLASSVDDLAIVNHKWSRGELLRFAQARARGDTRALWPIDRDTSTFPSQTLHMPVGASILEAQAAQLDAVLRLTDLLTPISQGACENGSDAARAEIDAHVARIGRTLRQSAALGQLTRDDLSNAAQNARKLFASKRAQITRGVEVLTSCRNPFGMAEREVPLYFGSIAPNINETAAFFAASNHLLELAEQRTTLAQNALNAVRVSWEQARQSEIQQVLTNNNRDIRVGEVQAKYGESMRRLCGISDLTAEAVADKLENGQLSPSTCYVKPTSACLDQNATRRIADIDPACYRGSIGGAFLDIRTAFFAHQAADRAWQAAIGDATAAEKLCVLKEMDLFGCEAVDRHALSGVTCPAGHEGTLTLIANFNDYLEKKESERGWWRAVGGFTVAFAGAIAASVATGGIAAPTLILAGAVATEIANLGSDTIESRKRAHDLLLTTRAQVDEIRECWNKAEQFQRAIGAAEQSASEALSRMDSARLAFENGLGEARAIELEAPVVIKREKTRPAIPIAFHYWLPELLEDYHFALASARRYTYVALRATEYDALELFQESQVGKPDRASVIEARRPDLLRQQLLLMRDQTNSQQTHFGPPALKHMAFDLGAAVFGLDEGASEFGATLTSFLRPAYSRQGEYLGQGLRISLLPTSGAEEPVWRCAERIWRVNAGAAALPTTGDGVTIKLRKRNVFASRACGSEGLQVSTLRPGGNLLVAGGEPQPYSTVKEVSVADITLQNFDDSNVFNNFKTRDDFLNGSSSELTMQGMYGDYVLLFPPGTFSGTFTSTSLRDFWMRFDYVSVDNTPAFQSVRPAKLAIDANPAPITVD